MKKLKVLKEDDGAPVLEVPADEVSRRKFFGLVGSGAALAGMAGATTGCIRKPKEHILPYAVRPEDAIPGKPMQYATAFALGGSVEGIVVESHDGRPTKIEGNPGHPGSQGGTSAFAQASILDLYDPDRSRRPRKAGEAIDDWTVAKAGADEIVKKLGKGQGVALVTRHITSPTLKAQIKRFKKAYPQAQIFECDPAAPTNAIAAAEALGGDGARVHHVVDGVKVMFAADSDFLNHEQDSTRLSREWSWGRRIVGPTDRMSRLYCVEPHLSGTGTMADHRARVKASEVGDVLLALVHELLRQNGPIAQGNDGKEEKDQRPTLAIPTDFDPKSLPKGTVPEGVAAMVKAAAGDLLEAIPKPEERVEEPPKDGRRPRYRPLRGSAVLVGARQPTWVHALGYLINAMLGNAKGASWTKDVDATKTEPLSALAAGLGSKIKTVLCFDCNPVYDAPADLGLKEKLEAAVVLHAGTYYDETAAIADWHLPLAHYLESWGDQKSSDGTVTICQPLIEPLHDVYAPVEMMGYFATKKLEFDDIIVKTHWRRESGRNFSDRAWRKWLHDGVKDASPREPSLPTVAWAKLGELVKQRAVVGGTEVNFHLCPTLLDGRYANNGWLQELPHPLTKICWDNAAYVSPAMAEQLGVKNEDMVTVSAGGGSLELPVFIAPGQAENTVSITLGGGRTVLRDDNYKGVISEGAGFNPQHDPPGCFPLVRGGDDRRRQRQAQDRQHAGLRFAQGAGLHGHPGVPQRAAHRVDGHGRRVQQGPQLRRAGELDAAVAAQAPVGSPEAHRQAAVGDEHRPQHLHRVHVVCGRLPVGEQHPRGGQGPGHRRPGDALDPPRPVLPGRGERRPDRGFPADDLSAVRVGAVRDGLPRRRHDPQP